MGLGDEEGMLMKANVKICADRLYYEGCIKDKCHSDCAKKYKGHELLHVDCIASYDCVCYYTC